MRVTIGVDLGQARDATALAAVVARRVESETDSRRPRRLVHHDLVDLQRLRPGVSYPDQVKLIVAFAARHATETTKPTLYVDATGVGRPVGDLLRAECPFPVRPVVIGSGMNAATSGDTWSVPKADLIGALDVALSTRRLHVTPGLPLASALEGELRAYSFELSPTGRAKFEGRSSHDDLVIALALSIWGTERGAKGSEAAWAFQEMMRSTVQARRSGQLA